LDIIEFNETGIPNVTSPAPERSAAFEDNAAAPVNPLEPAKIKTWPKSPL
jgi:hypothetical protein